MAGPLGVSIEVGYEIEAIGDSLTECVFCRVGRGDIPAEKLFEDEFVVAGPGGHARTLSGAAVGSVVLSVPLLVSRTGKTYTISWAATFDNGNHLCPSPQTPDNTAPNPFIVTVT